MNPGSAGDGEERNASAPTVTWTGALLKQLWSVNLWYQLGSRHRVSVSVAPWWSGPQQALAFTRTFTSDVVCLPLSQDEQKPESHFLLPTCAQTNRK